MARLYSAIRQSSQTTKNATIKVVKDTIYRGSKTSLGSIVQPFQKGFTPKGDLEFKPATIDLFKMKIDLAMYPDYIE